jgi:hypothetical protein
MITESQAKCYYVLEVQRKSSSKLPHAALSPSLQLALVALVGRAICQAIMHIAITGALATGCTH